MKWAAMGGAVGCVLLLGACIVQDRPPPPRYYYYGYYPPAPRPPPPGPPPPMAPPPGPPAAPAFADRLAPTPPPMPHPRFPARIVHPPPLEDVGAQFLDVRGLEAMVLRLRPNRKCGPRQLDGGHWIHLDCNVHAPVRSAKAFTPDKLDLLLQGLLNLDTPISIPGVGTLPQFPGAAPGTIPPSPAPGPAPTPSPGTTVKPKLGALPDSVDHRRDGTEGPVKDQGQVGCCTAFSLSTAMDNAIRRQNSSDTTSTLHIWSHYANPIVQDAGDKNLHKPIALWASWPYDERTACELDTSSDHDCGPYFPPVIQGSGSRDPQVQTKIKESDAGGQWQITEYDAVPRDPDTIAAFLATGADVWGSMDIGNDWLHVKGDTVPDWAANDLDGGHALVFAGYRHVNGQRQFLVHNSWGATWGDRGYAYVSEAMLKGFLRTAYKVVVTPKAASAAATAAASSALTDDDCGDDALVDLLTGRCTKMCADASRPSGGKCGRR
jgi:hypothetical protein